MSSITRSSRRAAPSTHNRQPLGGIGPILVVGALVMAALAGVTAPSPATATATTAGQITTYAGGPGAGVAVGVAMDPRWVATRGSLVYISDGAYHVVRELDTTTGRVRVVAGNGTPGSSGDGGPATSAQLWPGGLAIDSAGNILVADTVYHRVRKIDLQSGRITTIAGTGDGGFSGDGGPATAARLASPADLALDGLGNLFIADGGNYRIRRVDSGGTITTVAGNGLRGESGDGGPALQAAIDVPQSVTVNPLGEFFVIGNARIRKVGLDGVIKTFAGNGVQATTGDGGPALLAGLEGPSSIELDGSGNLFISEYAKVRKVDVFGTISTVAGNRQEVFAGDGGPAIQATVKPAGLAVDDAGNLYIANPHQSRVRRVGGDGMINTVAGSGNRMFSGAGGPAVEAQIGGPFGGLGSVATDDAGNVYMATYNAVLRVDPDGVLTHIAGDPLAESGFGGDGGPATAARLNWVGAMAVDGLGNLFLADTDNHRIRRVDPFGTITTVAGNGGAGYSGDGGPATQAALSRPVGLTADAAGNLFIADHDNHRVRWVDVSGTITTIAGTGVRGSGGDGGPSTQAQLDFPSNLAIDPGGALHILEGSNRNLRRISASGTITSVPLAGTNPTGFAFDAAGQLYVSEWVASFTDLTNIQARVHRIVGGTKTVIAGSGPEGFSGDGGPAPAARISRPRGIAFDPSGNLYVSDYGNGRIRQVAEVGPRRDAPLVSWGLNFNGQLGRDAGGTSLPAGVGAAADASVTVAVRAGTAHSLALAADGTVSSWGFNILGQLGIGTTADATRPVNVEGVTDVKAIGTGYLHSLVVRQDGSVMTWGWNEFAQLGNGSTNNSGVPVAVPGLTGAVAVAGGASHSLALKDDGTVWAWGLNHLGQLGIGAAAESRVPVKVPGLTGVVAIAAGAFHSVALKDDGTVWTWGWNIFGQLGTGLTLDRRTPTQVHGLPGVTGIASGAFHVLAVKDDGTVWGFGLNHLAQLGQGPVIVASAVKMAGVAGISDVAAGAFHSLALTHGGTALAWGYNAYGQLGDGSTTDRNVPVQVAALRNVVGLAAGVGHTLAVTSTD